MRVVLIGNYPKDRQESMERFARMLESGLNSAGHTTEIWRPTVFFGSFFQSYFRWDRQVVRICGQVDIIPFRTSC